MVKYVKKTNNMPYSPVITTPIQLEEKLGALRVFIQKENLRLETKKIVTL